MKYRAAGTTCAMAESENSMTSCFQISHKWTLLRMCHSWHSPSKARAVRADLCNVGFVVNEDKSVWEPTQVLDWLGITWSSALGTLKIVKRRIVKIINTIDHIIEADFEVSARELASFTGQILSIGPVVGNIGRIMTRHCILSTLCRDKWDSISHLDDYCKEELYFWKENMVNIKTRYCFVSKVRQCYWRWNNYRLQQWFCVPQNVVGEQERWKFNVSVIEFSLQSFASVLEGSHVKLFTDSQVAATTVEVGSVKLGLHKMARRIFA